MLGSAAARPQTTVAGDDAYPDLWTKASGVLQSILKNHALVDGNKRLGWLASATFLEINGIAVTHVTNDAVYDLVIELSATRTSRRSRVLSVAWCLQREPTGDAGAGATRRRRDPTS